MKLNATWLRNPWPMTIWDMAYQYLVRAGQGDAKAKAEVDGIKAAAAQGDPRAAQVKTNFDAVAKMIIKGLPKPSVFVARQRRASPLVRGQQGAATDATVAKLKETIRRQQQVIQQQRQRQLQQQLRKPMEQQVAQTKARAAAAARVAARAQEQQEYQAQVDMLKQQLERRDLEDAVRKQLEDQAAQYEGLLEAAQRGEPTAVPQGTEAELPEAEQDDTPEAYDSGAPGDVEFSNAGD